jgi:hypothetical protein
MKGLESMLSPGYNSSSSGPLLPAIANMGENLYTDTELKEQLKGEIEQRALKVRQRNLQMLCKY